MTALHSRRDFLKTSALLSAPWVASRLGFAESATVASDAARDVLVVVFARGAMDGLNVVVPYADPDYHALRPNLALARPGDSATAVLDLDGHFGLHPALASLKPLYEGKQLAFVHATGAPGVGRSHFTAQDVVERAEFRAAGNGAGWLNRHLAGTGSDAMFAGVGIGSAVPRALTGTAPVVGVNAFADFKLSARSPRSAQLHSTLRDLYGSGSTLDSAAQRAFSAVERIAALDPAHYAPENAAQYPQTPFAKQMLEVAQLIKAGVGLQVAAVDIGGWDHHFNELKRLQPLLEQFGKTLAAFSADLGTRMQRVSLVVMSEFGRRAHENASGGTDHGSGNCMFALGGGVNGGKVYADWPGLDAAHLQQGDLAITTDYRIVLAEWLRKRRRETAIERVFPGFGGGTDLGVFKPLA